MTIRRSPLKGTRKPSTFVTGLPTIRVIPTLVDALDNLQAAKTRRLDYEARNSHRRHSTIVADHDLPDPHEIPIVEVMYGQLAWRF